MIRRIPYIPLLLFCVSGFVLLKTVVPTLYSLDSPEFVTGAYTLGYVHAPGYPLYLLLLHLWLQIFPVDPSYAGNLFSAICLALTIPVLYGLLTTLKISQLVAAVTTLLFAWSYYVWLVGLFAEIYAPQMLFIALTAYSLARMRTLRDGILAGICYGLAIAINPTSLFLAPAVALTFILKKMGWKSCLLSGGLTILIFLATLIYFPLRFPDAYEMPLNLAGTFNAIGAFQAVPLNTLDGILWMVLGRQFDGLFFADGLLPTFQRTIEFLVFFGTTWLGFGLILGLLGITHIFNQRRKLFWCWLAAFAPYTYFFLTYGALDRVMMFGPSLLLWAIPLAFSLEWLAASFSPRLRYTLLGLPFLLLIVNYSRLDLSQDYSVHERTAYLLNVIPEEAFVFGQWTSVVPMQYLQIVEQQRPDLHLYNTFLFEEDAVIPYIYSLTREGLPVIALDSAIVLGLEEDNFQILTLAYEQLRPGDPVVEAYLILPSTTS